MRIDMAIKSFDDTVAMANGMRTKIKRGKHICEQSDAKSIPFFHSKKSQNDFVYRASGLATKSNEFYISLSPYAPNEQKIGHT